MVKDMIAQRLHSTWSFSDWAYVLFVGTATDDPINLSIDLYS